MNQPTLFDAARLDLSESIELTIRSLESYGPRYEHWGIAYSGGKDSSTLVTLIPYLIRTGRIQAPKRLTICYADTRMELPPLAAAAKEILGRLASEGFETHVAIAPMDKRFFVYMIGRGVPPPNNQTFRWCTRQIKVEPMIEALASLGATGKVLMLTGVRQGESAIRDGRIAMSCSRNGAECGQGWYQESLPDALCDTLAPILHWRVCLVWDWLTELMQREWRHGYPTRLVAEAYGANEEGGKPEANARTGCNGCPLANEDLALDNLLQFPKWDYLRPLKELRPLYRWLREPSQRLRKPGWETGANGVRRWTNRLGPLTFEARKMALAQVLEIQDRCNRACPSGMPPIDTLNTEEVARIEELIAARTWPNRWSGEEPTGDSEFVRIHSDGFAQHLLWTRQPSEKP